MMPSANSSGIIRFGDFELDRAAYELRRESRPVRLERQPMDLLIMLAERQGQLVSRDEIVERLWGKDVFVDVETGVHTAIRKIRRALGDSAEEPAFIETVSGKGYRFIASVQAADKRPALPDSPADVGADFETPRLPEPAATARFGPIAIGLLIAAAAVAVVTWVFFGRSAAPGPVNVAVLPFENIGADADRTYLADGLTEEIIAWLSQVDPGRLTVVSRTSATLARREATSLEAIGRQLRADYLVETSIRTEGGRARITAKLTRVRDQVQVWTQVYTRDVTSMLGLQQELGVAIAEQIRFRLTPERSEALSRREPRVAAAYDEYLRGVTFANQRTRPTTKSAIEHYQRATDLDPGYALAWSALAVTLAAGTVNSDVAPLEVTPQVEEAVRRAVSSNPQLAEAHYALAYLKWMLEWQWPAAESELRLALDLDRRHGLANIALGHVLSQMGRHGEALAAMRRARELDPQSAMAYAISSQVAFQARDFQAALDHASQAIALEQEFWIGHMMRGQAYEQSGNDAEALQALAIAARFSGENSKVASLRGYILAKTGRRDQALEIVNGLEAQSRQRYVPPYALALVYAGLGDTDALFRWLERAFDARDIHLIYLVADPKWDPYRSDSRFDAIVKRCGFVTSSPAVK